MAEGRAEGTDGEERTDLALAPAAIRLVLGLLEVLLVWLHLHRAYRLFELLFLCVRRRRVAAVLLDRIRYNIRLDCVNE